MFAFKQIRRNHPSKVANGTITQFFADGLVEMLPTASRMSIIVGRACEEQTTAASMAS
jgi:hypothetical protein